MSSQRDSKEAGEQRAGTRVVVLIARPLPPAVQKCLAASGFTDPPTAQPIDWDSTSNNIDSVPRILENLCFARHYAVAVVDDEVWDDPSLTLLAKFLRASYWEHGGASSSSASSIASWSFSSRFSSFSSAAAAWGENEIRTIEAIEDLGRISQADSDISNTYYAPLMKHWAYFPVWWNCHDFAFRLSYLLLVDDQASRYIISTLAGHMRARMVERIIEKRDEWLGYFDPTHPHKRRDSPFAPGLRRFRFGEAASWDEICENFVKHFDIQIYRTLCGAPIVAGAFAIMDIKRARQWRAAMAALEKQFPHLKRLHEYILEACRDLVGRLEQRYRDSSGLSSHIVFVAMECLRL